MSLIWFSECYARSDSGGGRSWRRGANGVVGVVNRCLVSSVVVSEDQSWEWGTSAMRATKTRWMLENFLVVRRNSSPSTNPALAWLVCQGFFPSLVWGRLGLGVSHSGFLSWQGTGGPAAPTSACSFQLLFPFPCTVFRQKGMSALQPTAQSRKLYALPAWACGRIHDSDSVFRIVLELVSLISQCHQKRLRESGQSESKATVI